MVRVSFLGILSLAAFAASPPAYGNDGAAQRRALDRHRAMWTAQHLRNYRFRLRFRCFCPSSGRATIITVRQGRPRGATGFQTRFDTIPELFGQLRRALDDPQAGEVKVRYDAGRGFPRTASIDRIKNAIDDEIGWTVDRFRPLR